MKKNFILTIALFATVTLSACSEIEDGVNRMDEWEDEKIEVDYPASFVHPGIMHTNNDIERLREIVTNREQPGYVVMRFLPVMLVRKQIIHFRDLIKKFIGEMIMGLVRVFRVNMKVILMQLIKIL